MGLTSFSLDEICACGDDEGEWGEKCWIWCDEWDVRSDVSFAPLLRIDSIMMGSLQMSHSFSVSAWGLERSQDCYFCSDSSFSTWEGLEMMNRRDKLASDELSFSYISFHLGLWWYKSILILIFLSLSLSTIWVSCRIVYLGRTLLVLSPSGLICLWPCEIDRNVPFACSGFLEVFSISSVCWWVCEVGAWQLLVCGPSMQDFSWRWQVLH